MRLFFGELSVWQVYIDLPFFQFPICKVITIITIVISTAVSHAHYARATMNHSATKAGWTATEQNHTSINIIIVNNYID